MDPGIVPWSLSKSHNASESNQATQAPELTNAETQPRRPATHLGSHSKQMEEPACLFIYSKSYLIFSS